VTTGYVKEMNNSSIDNWISDTINPLRILIA
jgi:hypothetical protein